ncbi:MAG: hypothetical protein K8I30_23695 [Anaerolineae bacterium]|nr:hypothetical protein [Anaerolineae bacterium]
MSDEMVSADESVTEEPIAAPVEAEAASPGFWQRVRSLVFGDERQSRLETLTAAIEQNSAAPVNYVLRGELYLEMGDYAAALADFEYAEKVASYRVDEDNWGVIAQALRDRAQAGIAKVRRRLHT